jgi:hypothetical protein
MGSTQSPRFYLSRSDGRAYAYKLALPEKMEAQEETATVDGRMEYVVKRMAG